MNNKYQIKISVKAKFKYCDKKQKLCKNAFKNEKKQQKVILLYLVNLLIIPYKKIPHITTLYLNWPQSNVFPHTVYYYEYL